MSRLRLTFWGSRPQEKSGQARSGALGAPTNKRPKRFQLRRSAQEPPAVEWQWGQEESKLFQLQRDSTATPNGLTLNQHPATQHPATPPTSASTPTPPGRASNPPADLDRWRRPAAATNVDNGNGVSPSSALVGEILPATDETATPWTNANAHPAASTYRATSPKATAALNGHYANGLSDRRAATGSALLKPFTGEEGVRRVLATRIALDEALDRWWTNGEHAPLALLRDGLLALEAGHELDETQRSFLLRTALRTGRGIVTALQYQLDADRTAFLFKEALLDTKRPFDPQLLSSLRQQDEQSEEWADYLEHDLAYEATVASGKRSQLAAAALQIMQTPPPEQSATMQSTSRSPANGPVARRRPDAQPALLLNANLLRGLSMPFRPKSAELLRPLSHRWSLRWLLWAILVLFVLLRTDWPQLISSAPMVEVPAGTYVISDPASSNPAESGRFRTVTLLAYTIDQHEVTNLAYRRCWEQKICPTPSSFDSQSRPGYFVDRSFNDFPVVNIDWAAANTYCTWIGKRLPTLEEWEVAASLAPTTGLRYSYPWGERFEMRVVNSALSNINDTQAVGAYHPAGSTPLGIMDMAGNVAEWTSMPASSMVDAVVVKGGSFQDPPEQLRNDVLRELPRATSAPWLGFRCAADQ